MSLSFLPPGPVGSPLAEGRLEPRGLTVISSRCIVSGRLVLLSGGNVDRDGIDSEASSNLDNTTVSGSSAGAPIRPLLPSEDAEGLVLPLGPLRAECMLCVRGRVPLGLPYSGKDAKLCGLTMTLYVPGAFDSAFRSRSSSLVRSEKDGRSSYIGDCELLE